MFKAKNGFRRGAVVAVFFALLFFSYIFPARAQTNIDPVCWQKEDCVEARKKFGFGDQEAADGFLKDLDPCVGGGWGKCLPAGKTTASIALGGKKEFADIGDYIQTVYKYVLSVVGILAAVLIVVSGIQWTSSAGNSEAIGAAKKRIGGALIGLVIAYSSYIILNTINPALVNLRLPQAFMLRNVPLDTAAGSFCRTEGELYTNCTSKGAQGEYACYPFFANGPLQKFAEYFSDAAVSMFPVPIPGGASSKLLSFLEKRTGIGISNVGGWVFDKAVAVGEKAGTKYYNFFFKTPLKNAWKELEMLQPGLVREIKEITVDKIKDTIKEEVTNKVTGGITVTNVGNAVVSMLGAGTKVTMGAGGILATGGAVWAGVELLPALEQTQAEAVQKLFTSGNLPEDYFLPDDVYDILLDKDNKSPGLPGVCEPTHSVPNGLPCNAEVEFDCVVGSKCVDIGILTGWVKGVKFGICSSGGLSSVCATSADCKNGAVCVNDEMDSKVCSDGSYGAVCTDNPSICTPHELVCRPSLDGGPRSYCVSDSLGQLGDGCTLPVAEQTGDILNILKRGTCELSQGDHGAEYLWCLTPPGGISFGVCGGKAPGDPCYSNKHCDRGYCAGAQLTSPYIAGTCTE